MPRVAHKARLSLPTRFEDLVRLYPPRAIHDEVEYDNAQEIIDRLTDLAHPTRGQLEYLDTLSVLVEAYEEEHHAIDASDLSAVDLLRSLMEEHGMNTSDLGRLLGDRSLGPRILNGQRDLSKAHILKLATHFGISPSLLLR
jgi:HTH-type transcriptional regulator/antitoxin HigA